MSKLRKRIPPMPPTTDMAVDSLGYFDSPQDWMRENVNAVQWLAENHAAIRAAISSGQQSTDSTGRA